MLHVDLIAPIATPRPASKQRPDQVAYWDCRALRDLCATGQRTASIAANLTRAASREGRQDRDLSAERGRLDRSLLRRPARRRGRRADQLRRRGRRDRLSPDRRRLQARHHDGSQKELVDKSGCGIAGPVSLMLAGAGAAEGRPALDRICSGIRGDPAAIPTTSIAPPSSSTRPAPPGGPRACCCRCAACCGSPRHAGRRSAI